MTNRCHAEVVDADGHLDACNRTPVVGTIRTHDGYELSDPYPVCAHHMQQAMEAE